MGCPWIVHGQSMDRPRPVQPWPSMDSYGPRVVHGLPRDCPWIVHGLPWTAHGQCVDSPWIVHGRCMDCLWVGHALYMDMSWTVYGQCVAIP
eukprot:9960398-Lingulodinium_polyedra.AAC.1